MKINNTDEFNNDDYVDPDNSLLLLNDDEAEIGLLMQDFPPENRGD